MLWVAEVSESFLLSMAGMIAIKTKSVYTLVDETVFRRLSWD
jgi:hypothetical protein